MNRDCFGDEFERHGKRWQRCFMDGTIYEAKNRTKVCPHCNRPWEGSQMDGDTFKEIKEDIEHQVDVPEMLDLLKLSMENFDDDLEERPMRHSIGKLYARIKHMLADSEALRQRKE